MPSAPVVFRPAAKEVVVSQAGPPAPACAARAAALLGPAALGPWRSTALVSLSRSNPPFLGFYPGTGSAPWVWWRSQTVALLNLPRYFDSLNPDRIALEYPNQVFEFVETLNTMDSPTAASSLAATVEPIGPSASTKVDGKGVVVVGRPVLGLQFGSQSFVLTQKVAGSDLPVTIWFAVRQGSTVLTLTVTGGAGLTAAGERPLVMAAMQQVTAACGSGWGA